MVMSLSCRQCIDTHPPFSSMHSILRLVEVLNSTVFENVFLSFYEGAIWPLWVPLSLGWVWNHAEDITDGELWRLWRTCSCLNKDSIVWGNWCLAQRNTWQRGHWSISSSPVQLNNTQARKRDAQGGWHSQLSANQQPLDLPREV